MVAASSICSAGVVGWDWLTLSFALWLPSVGIAATGVAAEASAMKEDNLLMLILSGHLGPAS